jgi:hypothetical protein
LDGSQHKTRARSRRGIMVLSVSALLRGAIAAAATVTPALWSDRQRPVPTAARSRPGPGNPHPSSGPSGLTRAARCRFQCQISRVGWVHWVGSQNNFTATAARSSLLFGRTGSSSVVSPIQPRNSIAFPSCAPRAKPASDLTRERRHGHGAAVTVWVSGVHGAWPPSSSSDSGESSGSPPARGEQSPPPPRRKIRPGSRTYHVSGHSDYKFPA